MSLRSPARTRIHGSAYEYLRNDYFDANGYLNNTLLGAIPTYRYNDFGFSFGGPVYIPKIYDGRNKTFFFVSEEFQRFCEVLIPPVQRSVPTRPRSAVATFTHSGLQDGGTWTTQPMTVCTAFTNNATNQVNYLHAQGTKVTRAFRRRRRRTEGRLSNVPAQSGL